MHISQRELHFQRCDVTRVESSVEFDDECSRPVPFTRHRKQNPWKRMRKTVGDLFARSHKKHVEYTSLKPAVRFSVSDDVKRLFKKDKKKNCTRVILNESNEEPSDCSTEDDDWEEHDFTLNIKRSASFDRRRMAICKEIEKNTKLGSKSTSLLELRKTLVINNRFMEMGLS